MPYMEIFSINTMCAGRLTGHYILIVIPSGSGYSFVGVVSVARVLTLMFFNSICDARLCLVI